MNKFIKTDHNQQSLVMDEKTCNLILQALELLTKSDGINIPTKSNAYDLLNFILDRDNYDCPTLFHRFRDIENCTSCNGSGKIKLMPDQRQDEVRFEQCETCCGEGQLYFIIVKKGYAPTEKIRRQMAK